MKSFIIIGAGSFGGSIARELSEQGYDAMVVDKDEEKVNVMSQYVTHAVIADGTDETGLKNLGVRNFDVGVVSIGGDFGNSVLVTMALKNLGVKYVVAKATSRTHAKVLEKVGADRIVFPEKDMGIRVANSLMNSSLLEYIELSPKYSIMEIAVPKAWIGKSISKLNVRAKYGLNIVAIKTGDKINVTPDPEYIFTEEDIPIVIGMNEDIKKF